MIKKMFRFVFNSIRFIGKPSYFHILALEFSARIEKGRQVDMHIGKSFRARRNVELNLRSGKFTVGNNVFFNSGCIVAAREAVSIGDGTIFGPNVMIYDHDHKVEAGRVLHNEYVCSAITIGKNVWVGGGSIILKGANIGDNCVIAAGSVVTGCIPANSVLVQKREKTILHR